MKRVTLYGIYRWPSLSGKAIDGYCGLGTACKHYSFLIDDH